MVIGFFCFFCVLSLAIFSNACPTYNEFRLELKKGVFVFLANPQKSPLTIEELKDMLVFYLTRDVSSADCETHTGALSGHTISSMLQKTSKINLYVIPKCQDGTLYGECSTEKPNFCYSGRLVLLCTGADKIVGTDDDCGCSHPLEVCNSDGTCTLGRVICVTDDDCGIDGFVGGAYCIDSAVYKDYVDWSCDAPGSLSSRCVVSTTQQKISNCAAGCLDGACL
ncbi:MAG: hypothetical protein QXK37_04805 [Candidatus Woesearchaeota archaeon]